MQLLALSLSAAMLSPVDLPHPPAMTKQTEPQGGSWLILYGEAPENRVVDFGMESVDFTGNVVTWGWQRAAYMVRTDRSPAWIDITFLEGELKGQTWRGIYRHEGNELE